MKCTQFTNFTNNHKELEVKLNSRELECIRNCMFECLERNNSEYSNEVEYWELYLQVADISMFLETGNQGDKFVRKAVLEKIKEIEDAEKEKSLKGIENG